MDNLASRRVAERAGLGQVGGFVTDEGASIVRYRISLLRGNATEAGTAPGAL